MRVYVVTVYNSVNVGSFLQATALYHAIETLGFEPVFLETGIREPRKETNALAFRLFFHGSPLYAARMLKLPERYEKEISFYTVARDYSPTDAFILGSDEIWNLCRRRMSDFPVLWGVGLPKGRCISYAPSVNYATTQDIKNSPYAVNALNSLHGISVRDEYSCEQLLPFVSQRIHIVCDPTLLVPAEYFYRLEHRPEDSDYILVYAYAHLLTPKDVSAIRNFARQKKKKLVALSYLRWCDVNICADPREFLGYLAQAEYVITNTFHGTVLSTIYGKQFVLLGKSQKAHELLKSLHLDRYATADNLCEMIETDYDRLQVKNTIENWCNESLQYLRTQLTALAMETEAL